MKTLVFTLVICCVVTGGCSRQFSNEDSTLRNLEEQNRYRTSSETTAVNRYGQGTDDFGPHINLFKVFEPKTSSNR